MSFRDDNRDIVVCGEVLKVETRKEDSVDLYYKRKFIPNVSLDDIDRNYLPILDLYRNIGKKVGKKTITDINSKFDCQVMFDGYSEQGGYSLDDIESLSEPKIAPEPIIIEPNPDDNNGRYSYEYLMSNGRPFKIDMTSVKDDSSYYRVIYTDSKRVLYVRSSMISRLCHTSMGVVNILPDMCVKMNDGIKWRVLDIEKNKCFVDIMKVGEKDAKTIRHVWYKDFLLGNVTEDYEDKQYGYRNGISLCGATMVSSNGTVGSVEYVDYEGRVTLRVTLDKIVRVRSVQSIKPVNKSNIYIGYSDYNKGGEFFRVLKGERDNWDVWSCTKQVWYKGLSDSDIETHSFGEIVRDYSGVKFRNIQGIEFTILPNSDGSRTGDSDIKVESEFGDIVRSNIYGISNGFVAEKEYNMTSHTVNGNIVWGFGNVLNPEYVWYDKYIGKRVFKGVSGCTGETVYATQEGMKMEDEGMDIDPRYVPDGCSLPLKKKLKQSCGLSATIVGGWNDDNYTVRFPDWSLLFNVRKEDFEERRLLPPNMSILTYMNEYKQKDGGTVYVKKIENGLCDIFIAESGIELRDVRLSDIESGSVATVIKDGDYTNKIGMRYNVKLVEGMIVCKFKDGSLKSIPLTGFDPENVYPDYMYNTEDDIIIGSVRNIHALGFKLGSYIFEGVCRHCGERIEGDKLKFIGHFCK